MSLIVDSVHQLAKIHNPAVIRWLYCRHEASGTPTPLAKARLLPTGRRVLTLGARRRPRQNGIISRRTSRVLPKGSLEPERGYVA